MVLVVGCLRVGCYLLRVVFCRAFVVLCGRLFVGRGLLCGAWCALCVVDCFVFCCVVDCCCMLSMVRCLLFVDGCSLCMLRRRSLTIVRCLMCVDYCLLLEVRCLSSVAPPLLLSLCVVWCVVRFVFLVLVVCCLLCVA